MVDFRPTVSAHLLGWMDRFLSYDLDIEPTSLLIALQDTLEDSPKGFVNDSNAQDFIYELQISLMILQEVRSDSQEYIEHLTDAIVETLMPDIKKIVDDIKQMTDYGRLKIVNTYQDPRIDIYLVEAREWVN